MRLNYSQLLRIYVQDTVLPQIYTDLYSTGSDKCALVTHRLAGLVII